MSPHLRRSLAIVGTLAALAAVAPGCESGPSELAPSRTLVSPPPPGTAATTLGAFEITLP